MALIIWNTAYSVGVDSLDADHVIITSLINHLDDAKLSGSDEAAVAMILRTLIAYALRHFRREEAQMRRSGYVDLAAHIEQHRLLQHQLRELHEEYQNCLSLSVRVDQDVVGDGAGFGADAQEGAEGGFRGVASIEAEHELVEVGLEMLAAQAVIDAEAPAFEVGEEAMNLGQQHVGGRRPDDLGVVFDVLQLGIAGPAVAGHGGAGSDRGGDEAAQAVGGVVGYRPQPGATGTVSGDLDGARDQQLAGVAPPRPTGRWVVLGPVRNAGLVGFHQSLQGVALRKHPTPT